MADLDVLKARLTEAEAAEHSLAIGAKVQRVSVDGQNVEYTPANIAELRTYIQRLKSEIKSLSGESPRRNMGFTF